VKFKIDENLPVGLVADLHLAGHDADTVLDEKLAGATDLIVVAAALREGRILLTLDKGIANLIQHPV
jgi:predicted nuclease of predicted toxin-antitoxin system